MARQTPTAKRIPLLASCDSLAKSLFSLIYSSFHNPLSGHGQVSLSTDQFSHGSIPINIELENPFDVIFSRQPNPVDINRREKEFARHET